MVSQPEPLERNLALRRPPSMSSRTSITRRHRQNRSHHGGTSSRPQNEFPIFGQTGDIDILIRSGGREQRYLLHRLYLSQCSGFFDAGTSQEWSRAPAAAAPAAAVAHGHDLAVVGEDDASPRPAPSRAFTAPLAGAGRPRWRYELDDEDDDDEVPMLVQKPPSSTLFGGGDGGGGSTSRPQLPPQLPPPPPPPPPPPSTWNKPPPSQSGFFRTMANFSAMHLPSTRQGGAAAAEVENETLRDYDNLFRTFYNYPPNLDGLNIAHAYVQCKGLLNLADMYDALDVVGPRVDHHLLQFQGRLWKQIAKYPPSYLKIGYLARSKVIFAEALVHVVGQWPYGAGQIRAQLPEQVLEVIEDKVDELEDLKTTVEGRLFRLTLTTPRGERITPANGYSAWTAVSLFRQWFAENTTPPPVPSRKDPPATRPPGGGGSRHHHHHHQPQQHQPQQQQQQHPTAHRSRSQAPLPAPPAGASPLTPIVDASRVFRLLGAGGSAYLCRDELKRFLKLRPDEYSRDRLRQLEQHMHAIKELARDCVRPLMRNFLELDLGKDAAAAAGSLGYLTCTRVDDKRDFPWDDVQALPAPVGGGGGGGGGEMVLSG